VNEATNPTVAPSESMAEHRLAGRTASLNFFLLWPEQQGGVL
jgi:hypothetical protein